MKNIKNKLFGLLTSGLFLIAIQAVNSVSRRHMFQGQEPSCLKKYEKI